MAGIVAKEESSSVFKHSACTIVIVTFFPTIVIMVVIPWTIIIASYCPVVIPHIKLFTQNILTCIPMHCFDKKA